MDGRGGVRSTLLVSRVPFSHFERDIQADTMTSAGFAREIDLFLSTNCIRYGFSHKIYIFTEERIFEPLELTKLLGGTKIDEHSEGTEKSFYPDIDARKKSGYLDWSSWHRQRVRVHAICVSRCRGHYVCIRHCSKVRKMLRMNVAALQSATERRVSTLPSFILLIARTCMGAVEFD